MPYIRTNNNIAGIRGLMEFRPDSAKALNQLAQALLVDASPLSRAEREMIASYVSSKNECRFCTTSHGAIAAHLPGCDRETMEAVWHDPETASVSPKLKALLSLAAKVAESGLSVTQTDIDKARAQGSTDTEIHDTVLIAAAFCMFNRYVDGLGATFPEDPGVFEMVGKQRAEEGYLTKSVLVE